MFSRSDQRKNVASGARPIPAVNCVLDFFASAWLWPQAFIAGFDRSLAELRMTSKARLVHCDVWLDIEAEGCAYHHTFLFMVYFLDRIKFNSLYDILQLATYSQRRVIDFWKAFSAVNFIHWTWLHLEQFTFRSEKRNVHGQSVFSVTA